jgi:hypothetical protein
MALVTSVVPPALARQADPQPADSQQADPQPADPPQGAPIASAQVSGFDLGRLSPGLQEEIGRLAGRPLDREHLMELAARIEAEQPDVVAAVRVTEDPDKNVRVVFVVAPMRERDRNRNVNARYLIDRVEMRGVPDTDLSDEVRTGMQALVGEPLGADSVSQVEQKLRSELAEYDVRRRVVRGRRTGEVRLIFVVEKTEAARWLQFEPLRSNALFHSDQGWGAFLDFPLGGRDYRFTPIFAIDHADDLIEEYSGFGLRFESRRLGTDRLGASVEWSTFDQDWRDATIGGIAANPRAGDLYDQRSTITPLVTFALHRGFRVSGGVGITELEPLSGGEPGSRMANAVIVSVGYTEEGRRAGGHDIGAGFIIRAATGALESDYEYTRYFGQARFRYRRDRHTVIVLGEAGGIDGEAPLFERFSLGDSRTLRGWDKYDIAPTGGDRVVHTSLEYRYGGLGFFLDTGSVWDTGADARARVAAGINFEADAFFATLGFPLNTDDVRAVFTTGVRFGGVGIRKY